MQLYYIYCKLFEDVQRLKPSGREDKAIDWMREYSPFFLSMCGLIMIVPLRILLCCKYNILCARHAWPGSFSCIAMIQASARKNCDILAFFLWSASMVTTCGCGFGRGFEIYRINQQQHPLHENCYKRATPEILCTSKDLHSSHQSYKIRERESVKSYTHKRIKMV